MYLLDPSSWPLNTVPGMWLCSLDDWLTGVWLESPHRRSRFLVSTLSILEININRTRVAYLSQPILQLSFYRYLFCASRRGFVWDFGYSVWGFLIVSFWEWDYRGVCDPHAICSIPFGRSKAPAVWRDCSRPTNSSRSTSLFILHKNSYLFGFSQAKHHETLLVGHYIVQGFHDLKF